MSIQEMIKEKLSASQFESLSELLGISGNRLTRIMNNPSTMNADELQKLSALIMVDFEELISQYNAGHDIITLGDLAKLNEMRKVTNA